MVLDFCLVFLTIFIFYLLAKNIKKRKGKDKLSESYYIKPQLISSLLIGATCCFIFGYCFYLSIISDSPNLIINFILLGFVVLGILIILSVIDGFWCYLVDKDCIIKQRFWTDRKVIKFSDIDYCEIVRGYLDIYVKGQNKVALRITNSDENIYTLINGIKDENIPIKGRQVI